MGAIAGGGIAGGGITGGGSTGGVIIGGGGSTGGCTMTGGIAGGGGSTGGCATTGVLAIAGGPGCDDDGRLPRMTRSCTVPGGGVSLGGPGVGGRSRDGAGIGGGWVDGRADARSGPGVRRLGGASSRVASSDSNVSFPLSPSGNSVATSSLDSGGCARVSSSLVRRGATPGSG